MLRYYTSHSLNRIGIRAAANILELVVFLKAMHIKTCTSLRLVAKGSSITTAIDLGGESHESIGTIHIFPSQR
jgi:hypothetical protein